MNKRGSLANVAVLFIFLFFMGLFYTAMFPAWDKTASVVESIVSEEWVAQVDSMRFNIALFLPFTFIAGMIWIIIRWTKSNTEVNRYV